MKYCTKCGTALIDEAIVCTNCGCSAVLEPEKPKANASMITAAKVFMIIGTVLAGFAILPLAWCIPMTVHYCKSVKLGKPVSTAFKVCSLLFVSLLGGIFMLLDNN